FPTGIALDPATHTIYVANGTTRSLSLIDGTTCNAGTTAGCGQRVTAGTAGTDPIGIAVDRQTATGYTVNHSGTVPGSDGRPSNPERRSGCRRAPATFTVGLAPQFLAVAERTDTIYVANTASNTISVIDARTCNARTHEGCGRPRATIRVGPAPFALAV